MIKKLLWDSDFFNIKIADCCYQKPVNFKNLNDFDLIYFKSGAPFNMRIKGFRNSFSEVKMVFIKNIVYNKKESKNIFSIKDNHLITSEIYELAYESGKFSRFNLDPKFSDDKFKEFYRKWVDNAINNSFADDVLVYKECDKVLGFVTYQINADKATIGLIAVNPNCQGKGIGSKLLNHVEQQLFMQKINTLHIPTQESNKAACNFYTKLGYSIHEIIYIKHYWRNDPI
jgi:dTDP-4-amino-4,6-dideoxy-D-galactose acyltransferase